MCDLENHKNIVPTSAILQVDHNAHMLLDFTSGKCNQQERSGYLSMMP